VIRGLDEVEVGTETGATVTAKVVGHDRASDIALLKADAKLRPIEKGDSGSLRVGQFVLALANPYATKASATSGIITSANRRIGGWWGVGLEDAIVTDARLNPGYSGGPLLDAAGKMIGLNVAVAFQRGIAVPISTITNTFERLVAGKPVGRAYLGIVTNPVVLPESATTEAGSDQKYGLIVLEVEQGTPAKESGLTLGDVLLSFDGKPVERFSDLGRVLRADRIGQSAKIRILRGGKVEELSIKPTAAPEDRE
jgi:S1-C subfamily serine protease